MANTPEFNQAVHAATTEAIQTLNTNGADVFYPTVGNVEVVRKFLLAESVPQANWTSAFIWQAAMLECRKRDMSGSFPAKKTTEQRNAERRAADAAPGRQKYLKPNDEPSKNFLQQIRENVESTLKTNEAERTNRQTAEQQAAEQQKEILNTLPLIPYEQMTPDQQKQYRALSAENMKVFNKKQREAAHHEKYPEAFTGRR